MTPLTPATAKATPSPAAPAASGAASTGLETCEISVRRVAEPAFGGNATLEMRAIVAGSSPSYVAGRVRYRAGHAIDLANPAHRGALDQLVEQLRRDGWESTGERGQADYALRFSRPASRAPAPADRRAADQQGLADRLNGLTKHTKRLAWFFLAGLVLAALADLARGGTPRALLAWPAIFAIATALTWIMAATDDFRMGTQHRIPRRIETEGGRHPIGWYRFFLTRVVHPVRVPFGWLIPGSMYVVALAYLSGVLVQPAAVGALFLLGNMFLFLNLRSPRDDFVVLASAQAIVLVTNPGGIPEVLRALGWLA